jgi:hypothetical protein
MASEAIALLLAPYALMTENYHSLAELKAATKDV